MRIYGKAITTNLLSITLLLGTLFLSSGCSSSSDAQEGVEDQEARLINVVRISTIDHPEKLLVSGRVTHKREALLAFRVGGFIDRIYVEMGDRFQQGQLLAMLDTTEVAASYRDVVAQREQLERDLKRIKKLYEQDIATLQQLQEVETALERVKAGEQRARFTLDRTKIVAPFDGFVAMKMAEEGEMQGEGVPVLRVVDAKEKRRVRVGIPSRYLGWVKTGQSANIRVDGLSHVLEATIVETGAVAEPQTGNVLIELELPAHEALFEGVIVGVEIFGPYDQVITLPGGALAEGDEDRAFVFVVEDGYALRREVTIVEINQKVVYVKPTLTVGSLVVSEAAAYLRDGEAVRVDGETIL